jgi:hypothetical protein
MIATEHKNDQLFIRFTSDLITACDDVAIKFALQQALSTGTRNFVMSVLVGSLANQRYIAKLLRQCKEIVHSEGGNLLFVEQGDETDSMYRSICQSLEIPMFDSEEKIEIGVPLHAVA